MQEKGCEKMGTIKANANGGVINLTKGSDAVILGKGKDVLRVGTAAGSNVVNGFDSKNDIFEFAKGSNPEKDGVRGYSMVGNDLIVRLGKRNVTLKNMATKDIRARMQGSSKTEKNNFFLRLSEENGKAVNYAKNGSKYDWTKAVATAKFSGKFDMSDYNENLKTFDARNVRRSIEIVGTNRNDVIYAGNYGGTIRAEKGNDTIYLGKGTDVIRFGTNDGKNVVNGFESNKDIFEFAKGSNPEKDGVRGYSMVGNDLIVRLGKTNVTLKNMATKDIRARMQGSSKIEKNNFFKRISAENGNKIHYAKKGSSYDWTKVVADSTFSGKFDMSDYNENLKTFDGHAVKKAMSIFGSSRSESIIAGQAGSEIRAGKGNDTITCGNGKDRIWFAKGEGNDTVLKSGKNDVAYLYGVKDINQVTKKLIKGVMTLGIKGASDTLNISGWQAGKSLATVEIANHKKYTFGANGSFKLTK